MEYIFEEIHVEILDKNIKLLQITNVDEVFDQLIAQSPNHIDVIDERIPYWTELWPSAIGLSQYLIDNHNIIKEKRVLEIGCGLALPSIISGFCLPAKVIASDYLPDALDFVSRNWLLNHESYTPFQTDILDWRTLFNDPENVVDFDLILASDVIYEGRYVKDMLQLVKNMPYGMELILSEPGRPIAKEFAQQLFAEKYLDIRSNQISVTHRGATFNVNILHITKQFL
ncbi:MAG TPA: hypothetical protein PLZ32_20975 [Saprospiraceae bacterium]|nr:hypothetical protein [Saprospiraceae bacterium]